MSDVSLSPDLRRFIVAKLGSVSLLEALLLLRSRGDGWGVGELASRLYVPEVEAAGLIEELERQGLARRTGDHARYVPDPPEHATVVDELALVYSRRLIEVTQLIHSTVGRKAHQFADAFVIRKES